MKMWLVELPGGSAVVIRAFTTEGCLIKADRLKMSPQCVYPADFHDVRWAKSEGRYYQ